MRIAFWDLPTLRVPMAQDNDGTFYTVTPWVAGAVGVKEKSVDDIFYRNKDRLGLSIVPDDVKKFFRQNKAVFKIQRVRRIIHENDVLRLIMMFRTPEAVAAQDSFIPFLRAAVAVNFPSMEEFNALTEAFKNMQAELQALKDGVPFVQRSASAAGSALAAHRGTKHLRLVK